MADEGNRFGGGSVGVGTGAPPAPIEDIPDQTPDTDAWPERFDDEGNAVDDVVEADQQIYSDQPSSANKKDQADGALMKKAKQLAGDKLLGDKKALEDDSPEGRERLKAIARKKAREAAKKQIGKRIGNEGIKKGFEKGLSNEAGKLAKEGAQKAAKKAAKKVTEAAGKRIAQAGVQAGVKVGAKATTTAVVDVVGAASGVETFGLGFVLAFLLNIAISLGMDDAMDALSEQMKSANATRHGQTTEALAHQKQSVFYAVRGATKVGMFILMLIGIGMTFSVIGIFVAIPFLIFINIYMILGFGFRWMPLFQGLVWWEIIIILIVDIFAIIIALTFLAAMGWWICDQSGLGGGAVVDVATKVVDWWSGSTYASSVNEMCTSIKGIGGGTTSN